MPIFILAFTLVSTLVVAADSPFYAQFKKARECRHWEKMSETQKTDKEAALTISKKLASLKCPDLAKWNKTHGEFLTYVERRIDCNYWGGEEPYDKARAEEIRKAVAPLKCDKIYTEEKIHQKNKDYAEVIKHVDELDAFGLTP